MQPIIFPLAEARSPRVSRLGVGPSWQGQIPLPAPYLRVYGVTKDSTGAILGGCTVKLYLSAGDVLFDSQISDSVTGVYEFRTPASITQYYIVAYKAGSPDVTGTTVNTLIGV